MLPTFAAFPAPLVTVDRIRVCSAETTFGPNGTVGVSPGSGGSVTSEGGCHVPDWTTAAVMAMSSGLTCTLPVPMVSSASSAWLPGDRMVPANAVSGSCQDLPKPKPAAVAFRSLPDIRSDRLANAVEHAFAKSAWNVPRFGTGGSFVNLSPPTGFEALHGIAVLTPTCPVFSSAAVETIVNAWPGSYFPYKGLIPGMPLTPRDATASTWPEAGEMATIAAEFPTDCSALLAACCTLALMVVWTSVPLRPVQVCSTETTWPVAFSATTSVVGEPTSVRWNACCSPDSPTVVPGRYGIPSSCRTPAASLPTLPDTAEAMLPNSRCRCCSTRSPGTRASLPRSRW